MTSELQQIAYNEGCEDYLERTLSAHENPYDGVSKILADMWESGWWDMFYEDI